MLYVPDDKFVLKQNAVDLAMCVFDDKKGIYVGMLVI